MELLVYPNRRIVETVEILIEYGARNLAGADKRRADDARGDEAFQAFMRRSLS
jgi:hypothetical protein